MNSIYEMVKYALHVLKKKIQKVMPKLRGLETRGPQGDALTEIERIISDYSIVDDFSKAKNQGFGQFMWCSSDYIYKDPDSQILTEESTQEINDSEASKSEIPNIDSRYIEMAEEYKDDSNGFIHFKKRLIDEGLSQDTAKDIARALLGK